MDLYESVIRTISALIVVLGLMGVAAWAFRRFGRTPLFGSSHAPLIQILATAPLGSRKSISLVEIGDEILIVGSSATELVRLGQVRHPERLRRSRKESAGPLDTFSAHVAMNESQKKP